AASGRRIVGGDPAHVEAVSYLLERRSDREEPADAPEVGALEVVGPEVVEELSGGEKPEVLDHGGGPAGDVAGELLERHDRPLATAVADRVGHLGAGVADLRRGVSRAGRAVEGAVADEVADIR